MKSIESMVEEGYQIFAVSPDGEQEHDVTDEVENLMIVIRALGDMIAERNYSSYQSRLERQMHSGH